MSWSFHAIGKPRAVLERARKELPCFRCPEPEETVKGKFLDQLEAALSMFPEASAVQVTASGSQHAPDYSNQTEVVNSLSLEIKPIYGFVE